MAYGKYYKSKRGGRRSFKRRTAPLRRTTYKAVKSIVNKTLTKSAELKYKDTNIDFDDVNADGVATVLNIIPRGTANTSRVGERIKTKYLKISGRVWMPPSTGEDINNNYSTVVRMMVVYWRNLNGSSTLIPDKLLAVSGSPGATTCPLDFNQNKDWDVLYDKKMVLAATPTTTYVGTGTVPAGYGFANKKYFDIRIPVKRTVQYNSAEYDEAIENNPADGTLFFFMVSDSTNENDGASVDAISRLYYHDE